MGLAAFMAGCPPAEVTGHFREAFARYDAIVGRSGKELRRYATRSQLLLAEYCSQHGLLVEANAALMRAQNQVINNCSPDLLSPTTAGQVAPAKRGGSAGGKLDRSRSAGASRLESASYEPASYKKMGLPLGACRVAVFKLSAATACQQSLSVSQQAFTSVLCRRVGCDQTISGTCMY